MPPPLDHNPLFGSRDEMYALSFHAVSGMYPVADASVPVVFAEFQYLAFAPPSLNCVPPTATLLGVDASPPTANPECAGRVSEGSSQSADPASPAATKTEMPCAAACCHRLP